LCSPKCHQKQKQKKVGKEQKRKKKKLQQPTWKNAKYNEKKDTKQIRNELQNPFLFVCLKMQGGRQTNKQQHILGECEVDFFRESAGTSSNALISTVVGCSNALLNGFVLDKLRKESTNKTITSTIGIHNLLWITRDWLEMVHFSFIADNGLASPLGENDHSLSRLIFLWIFSQFEANFLQISLEEGKEKGSQQ
jgi:hypothetical protein